MAAEQLIEGVWFYRGVPVATRPLVLAHHLSKILGCDASAVRFGRDGQGRPRLIAPESDLVFSIAHRQETLLLAVARGEVVGCDLEADAPDDVARLDEALVRQFFSPGERDWFAGLDPAIRRPAFQKLWTGKEAVLKADGAGLSNGANEPDFTPFLEPGRSLPDRLDGAVFRGKVFSLRWFCMAGKDGAFMAAVARPAGSSLFQKEGFVNAGVSGIT